MKVLVSACLLGENCKYNGTNYRRGRRTDKYFYHRKYTTNYGLYKNRKGTYEKTSLK